MRKERGFLELIVIILVLGAALFGAYSYFQNVDKTKPRAEETERPESSYSDNDNTWQTYTSQKYNFQIDYPNTWQLQLASSTGVASPKEAFFIIGPNSEKVSILPQGSWETSKPLVGSTASQITFKGLAAKEIKWNDLVQISITDGIPNWDSTNRIEYNNPNDTTTIQVVNSFKLLQELDASGRFCGGIAANLPENQCPQGYKCIYESQGPDSSGTCQKVN